MTPFQVAAAAIATLADVGACPPPGAASLLKARRLREALGMTQDELAADLGVSFPLYHGLEHGRPWPLWLALVYLERMQLYVAAARARGAQIPDGAIPTLLELAQARPTPSGDRRRFRKRSKRRRRR